MGVEQVTSGDVFPSDLEFIDDADIDDEEQVTMVLSDGTSINLTAALNLTGVEAANVGNSSLAERSAPDSRTPAIVSGACVPIDGVSGAGAINETVSDVNGTFCVRLNGSSIAENRTRLNSSSIAENRALLNSSSIAGNLTAFNDSSIVGDGPVLNGSSIVGNVTTFNGSSIIRDGLVLNSSSIELDGTSLDGDSSSDVEGAAGTADSEHSVSKREASPTFGLLFRGTERPRIVLRPLFPQESFPPQFDGVPRGASDRAASTMLQQATAADGEAPPVAEQLLQQQQAIQQQLLQQFPAQFVIPQQQVRLGTGDSWRRLH